jgi:hypothetical protein
MEEGEISESIASQGEMDDAAKLQKLAMVRTYYECLLLSFLTHSPSQLTDPIKL